MEVTARLVYSLTSIRSSKRIMNCSRILLFILLCSLCAPAFGQRTSAVRAVGRAQQKQIMIRWGVTNAQAWKQSNTYGFNVTRFTVIRNKTMLTTPEQKNLGVFKPAAVQSWAGPANTDEYAAIIAQALYGESFEVTGDSQGIMSSVGQSQEAEQRFTLSLYAADRSFDAAVLAGWGLVDRDVKANEKYLYRITSAVPTTKLAIDSTGVFIGLEDYQPLPAVNDVNVLFTDKSAMLTWDYDRLKDHYNAFFVERSSDGTNFYRVTEKPVANISEQKNRKSGARVHYMDTVGMNNIKYYYRIVGVTAFGELGPASPVVSGISKKLLAYVPHITRSVMNDAGALNVEWEFEQAGNGLIKGFTLNQAQRESGPYFPVVNNIDPSKRSVQYSKLFETNYFTLTANAVEGESRTSMPVLVQPVDSIPPAPPTGLKVVIDSAGVARVTWTANTEKDIFGYKVFRAYVKDAELTPLTDSVFFGTAYTDTVSMRMTNRTIYYAVTALDRRYNQSAFSPRTLAMKPDVVPPSSPVFKRCELVDYAVKLTWADSYDSDVAAHILYRKADNEQNFKPVKQFKSKTSGEYVDNEVTRGHSYTYTIVSKDSSNLESAPAHPVSIKLPSDPDALMVKTFNVYIDRKKHAIELFWTDNLKNVEEYHLFRKKKGEPVTLWKIVKAGEKGFIDEGPAINTEYTYGIRVVTKTGEMSRMKWVVANY